MAFQVEPKAQATSDTPIESRYNRYIAFLRAINVGGHTVKMDNLRQLFEQMGFTNVETFIASGNVIFDTPQENTRALEEEIETHLHEALGYKVATFIRSVEEVVSVAAYEPFPGAELTETATAYVAFLPTPPGEAEQQKLMSMRNPVDDFHINSREIYWLRRTRESESLFSGALLEKTIKLAATMRNTTTIKRLAAKYGTNQP